VREGLPRRRREEKTMLRIYAVILDVIAELRPVVKEVERCDADLARQMRRAMCSVALNTAEGMGSRGKLRGARYHTALGSMQETMACIEVGTALGYLESVDAMVIDRMKRIIGTLVRLAC
jgi:four helix bundle protein